MDRAAHRMWRKADCKRDGLEDDVWDRDFSLRLSHVCMRYASQVLLLVLLVLLGLLALTLALHTTGGNFPSVDSGSLLKNAEVCKACAVACPAGPAPAVECLEKPKYVPPVYDTCDYQVFGGRPPDGYGQWPLCLNQVPPNSTIYSFGIGGDISFDLDMMRRGHRVYGFDPSVIPDNLEKFFTRNNSVLRPQFHFMQVGLGAQNGVVHFAEPNRKGGGSYTALDTLQFKVGTYRESVLLAPVLTLPTIMAAMKHDHVDLLKVDIEGVEFDVCDSADFLEALDKVGHLIYEFHDRLLSNGAERRAHCIQSLAGKGFTLVGSITEGGEGVFARMRGKTRGEVG